jgi:hypothetical protein
MEGHTSPGSFSLGGKGHGDLRERLIRNRKKQRGRSSFGPLKPEDVPGNALNEEGMGWGVVLPTAIREGSHSPSLPKSIPQGKTRPPGTDEEEVLRHDVQT